MVCSRKLTNSLFFVMLKSHSLSSLAVAVSMSTQTTGIFFLIFNTNFSQKRELILINLFIPLQKCCSVKGTIERYKKAISDNSNTGSVAEINAQYYQQESAKLRQQIISIQNSNRQLMGETIGSMSPKELRNLEGRLDRSVNRIRSKKNELLFAEIDYMQKREVDLHNDNQLLRAKIAENERNNPSMSLMPGGSNYEQIMPPPQTQPQPFDSRNYFQVAALQPNNHHYSSAGREDQTALQLV
uniref:K-box domain-containing protein n=1 Tax=Brassica campestris TaxID=3711 RepID=A0A3P5ZJM9_BRACM|nr:unnamed protein product [Brassica rapa]